MALRAADVGGITIGAIAFLLFAMLVGSCSLHRGDQSIDCVRAGGTPLECKTLIQGGH